MVKNVPGEDVEKAVLLPYLRALRGLAGRRVLKAFLPNTGYGPVVRI